MGEVKTKQSKKKEVCGGSGEAQLTGKKRKNEGTTLTNKDVNAKRSKKVSSQRLEWDEEDEIFVQQGMIDFRASKGKNPFDDYKETYDFLREYTTYEDYSYEFIEKMDSLKRKLMDQMKVNAKDPSHDPESSELLKKIWGSDAVDDEKPKRAKRIIKPKEVKQVKIHQGGKWLEDASVVRQIVSLGVDESSLNRKWDAVTKGKKKKIDQKWRVLRTKEHESMLQKSKFLKELVSLIVEVSSSSRLM